MFRLLLGILVVLCVLGAEGRSPQDVMCQKRKPYKLTYKREGPYPPHIERDVQLDDIIDGRPTVLALHTAHCLYCTTQAKYLGNIAIDLMEFGTNVSIIVINRAGYEKYTDYYMKHVYMLEHVYFMQDNWDTNAWSDLAGRKDDFFIFDKDQRLVMHKTGRGVSLTNFGWKDELYDMLNKMGSGWSPCDVQKSTSNRPVASVVSQFSFPHQGLCKRVPSALMGQLNQQGTKILALIDASVAYSRNQAKELGVLARKLEDKEPKVTIIIINAIGAAQYYDLLNEKLARISQDIVVVQDTEESGLWEELGGTRDDFLLYDESNRLMRFVKAPMTDMLHFGWRREMFSLLTKEYKTVCGVYQAETMLCKPYKDYSFESQMFSSRTYDRFTIVTLLQSGEAGVRQFEHFSLARQKMGHMPVTYLTINPGTAEGLVNEAQLREKSYTSRVYFLQDTPEGYLFEQYFGASGDTFYYDAGGALRKLERYDEKGDLLSKIRTVYRAADRGVECGLEKEFV